MTFGMKLTLINVLYVPKIRKNLVFGSLLNSHIFRIVLESYKFVLSKSRMYVGKGYMSDRMWKLNVMTLSSQICIELSLLLTCFSLLIYDMVD